jgi:hypothetical protein
MNDNGELIMAEYINAFDKTKIVTVKPYFKCTWNCQLTIHDWTKPMNLRCRFNRWGASRSTYQTGCPGFDRFFMFFSGTQNMWVQQELEFYTGRKYGTSYPHIKVEAK